MSREEGGTVGTKAQPSLSSERPPKPQPSQGSGFQTSPATPVGGFPEEAPRPLLTPEDRGIIERPMLRPNFQHHLLGHEAVMLVADTAANVLYGQRYADLAPLLDGTRDRHEIAAALQEKHAPLAVQTTLVSMATKGYICSAEYSMDSGSAAFWSEVGVSPRYAEQRLKAARIALHGDDPKLAAAIEGAGMTLASAEDQESLAVFVTRDYLDDANRELNRRRLEAGSPWMLAALGGIWPIFGPVFRPAEGPCWHCLAHRFNGNREVERFVRLHGEARKAESRIAFAPFVELMRQLAAVEIALWVVSGDRAALHEHAIGGNVATGRSQHRVMRRPQCMSCGDADHHRPDRPAVPVTLRPSPKPVRNSGGVRIVSPAETLRKYRHLVDPVSGVVTELVRTTQPEDSWLHVYWAGSNLALTAAHLGVLRSSLRTKSAGKGATPEQAEASALCEALERYSGVFHGDEIRQPARLSAFRDGEAIHPNDVQFYSDRQFDNAAEINAQGTKFNYVPVRLDPEAVVDWSPVWSLTEQRHRYLPSHMLYYAMPLPESGVLHATPDSNGCAAGNTLEEAILQGFLELVERDAFACWWYNRARVPEVDLESFGDPFLSASREYYARVNRDVWMLDVTHDLGIPVFIGVSQRKDKDSEDILYSAGSHLDPKIAALRAMCELNQYLDGVKAANADGTGYMYDDPETVHWWMTAKLEDHPYLMPAPGAPLRGAADYPLTDTEDARDDVEFCRKLVEGKGMEFLVLDQTRPDLGIPVAKVIVPGMRHFWARFAPGRIYDVPVEVGWLERPLAETELNPTHVFI